MSAVKSLSIATVLEKNKISGEVPFLVALEIGVIDPETGGQVETLRVVNNTEDVTFAGNVYTAAAFDIELKEEAGAQPQVTLSIADFSRALMQKLDTYGGGIGFLVTVMVIRGDTATMATDKPEAQSFFEVVGATAQSYRVNFTLGAENPLIKVFPRRKQAKNFCAWRYKEATTCGYTGGLVGCDLTLAGPNGCKAHGNAVNFGAFPGINNAGSRYA